MLKIESFPNSNLLGVTDTRLEVTVFMPGSTSYTDAQKRLVEAYKYQQHARKICAGEVFEQSEGSLSHLTHYCYQCDHETAWLAPDGRCGACTSYSPEEIRGEV